MVTPIVSVKGHKLIAILTCTFPDGRSVLSDRAIKPAKAAAAQCLSTHTLADTTPDMLTVLQLHAHQAQPQLKQKVFLSKWLPVCSRTRWGPFSMRLPLLELCVFLCWHFDGLFVMRGRLSTSAAVGLSFGQSGSAEQRSGAVMTVSWPKRYLTWEWWTLPLFLHLSGRLKSEVLHVFF